MERDAPSLDDISSLDLASLDPAVLAENGLSTEVLEMLKSLLDTPAKLVLGNYIIYLLYRS